jgi:hypothetical protein
MSKQAKEFFEQLKAGKESLQETVKQNLSLSKILGDVGKELKEQAKHGAHELAAALFNGSAFVMYPRTKDGKDDPQHGLPEQEQGRGGMER